MKFASPLAGFQGHIDALPELQTRKMALLQLKSVAEGKLAGVPWDDHASTGDLSDCFKLYFDPVGGDKPRFRLIYRLVDDQGERKLQAVAVGRRGDLDAYLRAARNLGRI